MCCKIRCTKDFGAKQGLYGPFSWIMMIRFLTDGSTVLVFITTTTVILLNGSQCWDSARQLQASRSVHADERAWQLASMVPAIDRAHAQHAAIICVLQVRGPCCSLMPPGEPSLRLHSWRGACRSVPPHLIMLLLLLCRPIHRRGNLSLPACMQCNATHTNHQWDLLRMPTAHACRRNSRRSGQACRRKQCSLLGYVYVCTL